MTEDEAKTWLTTALGVSRGTISALQTLYEKTAEENQKQNLVALSTLNMFWTRHVVDSAQLLPLAGHDWHNWVDLGSGAGFPGLVTALLSAGRVSLVEERRKRAEHLQRMLGVLICRIGLPSSKAASNSSSASTTSYRPERSHRSGGCSKWRIIWRRRIRFGYCLRGGQPLLNWKRRG